MPPLPQQLQNNIPILGQPCTFKALAGPQTVVECSCEAKAIILLPGIGVAAQCPACKRGRVLTKIIADSTTMNIALEFTDVAMPEER